MKILKLIHPLLLILCTISTAQNVETLVAGPSTFNDGLAVDMYGNIYASYYPGTEVTKITPDGHAEIYADGFNHPNGLIIGPTGNLFVANSGGNEVYEVYPDGTKGVFANVPRPNILLFLPDSTLLVGSYPNSTIYKVDLAANVTVWHSGAPLNGPIGLNRDEDGTIYTGNFNDGRVFRVNASKEFTQIGDVSGWMGFMTTSGDYIYATAYERHSIIRIAKNGSGQITFAGTGVKGTVDGYIEFAQFDTPNGITASVTGDTLYISESFSKSLRIITGLNTPTALEEIFNLPVGFNLEQNYPNPFNPTTEIVFDIPNPGKVYLSIYDTVGNEIATLLKNEVLPGRHKVSFTSTNLSSGVYFYKLNYGKYSLTKKMLLLK